MFVSGPRTTSEMLLLQVQPVNTV